MYLYLIHGIVRILDKKITQKADQGSGCPAISRGALVTAVLECPSLILVLVKMTGSFDRQYF